MCLLLIVRLNGSRLVTGVLRGFDPFMNLVIDEAVEECKTGEKNHIGMVVCHSAELLMQILIDQSCSLYFRYSL